MREGNCFAAAVTAINSPSPPPRRLYSVACLLPHPPPMKLKFLLAPLSAFALTAAAQDLLPPHDAFAFTATEAADGRIIASWNIADDYYLYRHNMAFAVAGGNLARAPQPPPGVLHWDSLFGEVEVYFGRVTVALEVAAGAGGVTVQATGQGCSVAVGVCYPEMTRTVAFAPGMPAGAAAAAESAADPGQLMSQIDAVLQSKPDSAGDLSPGQKLRALLGATFDQTDFLEVDDAFQLAVEVAQPNRLDATFTVADGYYLYRDKIAFSIEGAARVAAVTLPAGDAKDDPYLGQTAILSEDFSAPVTLQRGAPEAAAIRLHAAYQGCAEGGICYAPVSKTFDLALPVATAAAFGNGDSGNAAGSGGRARPGWLAGAFAAGLLLTFTPCVLPLLPILSAIIVGRAGAPGNTVTKTRGGALATVFVLGSVAVYAVIGAVAGATGEQLQAYFQNIWTIGALAAVLALLALSMFGVFTVRVPDFAGKWRGRLDKLGGAFVPVFALGAASAAVVGACVSPVLISFLGLALATADPVLGAQTMAAMALGMGAPLIALGLGAGYLLPKAGAWMQTLNYAFGALLLAVAIYLLGTLPAVPVLLLWGAFFVVLSVYLGATSPLPAGAGGYRRLVKGAGLVLLIWGAAALVGGFFGARDIWRPLPAEIFGAGNNSTATATATTPAQAAGAAFTAVAGVAELERELARAAAAGKPALVEYYADWCADCVRMAQTTFRNPRVAAALRRDVVALRVDVTDPRDPDSRALKRRFSVFGPPATLFFGRDGKPLPGRHFYGYLGADEFLARLAAL